MSLTPERFVARAAVIPLLFAAALAAQVPARFTLGDLRERVRQVQGPPQVIERLASQGTETWRYDGASVAFDPASGRVTGWTDPSRRLAITLRAEHHSRDTLVVLGTTLGNLSRLLGTPWAVARDPRGQALYLSYGRSVVRVDATSRVVNGWVRRDAGLRLSPADDSLAHAALRATPPPRPGPPGMTPAPAPAEAPALVVQRVLVRGSTERAMRPDEVTDLTLRVRNAGAEPTPIVPVQVLRDTGIEPIRGTPDTLWLPALAPGDSTDVVLSAYLSGAGRDVSLAALAWVGSTPIRLSARIPVEGAPSRPAAAPGERDILDAPAAAARPGDAVAVIIGVDAYRRLPEARFASQDARLMRHYLTRTLGVPDDPRHLAVRTGADATGGEMRRLLGDRGWLSRRTTTSTDLVVYFAGHGVVGADGRTPFLLPSDGDAAYADDTGLDLHALFGRLARLPARSITVLVDACFAGLGRDGKPLVPGTRAAAVSIEHPALLRPGMAVFLASRGTQPAGDLPERRHGLFTWHVARGLQGAADANADGAITVHELGTWVERSVTDAAARQDREQQPLAIARDSLRLVARLAATR